MQWEGNDTAVGIWYYEVFLDALQNGHLVGLETNYTFHGLADGSHTVIVRAHNSQGLTLDDSVTFYVDTSAPALDIISPANGDALNVSDIHMVWQASDPTQITYYQIKLDNNQWITPIAPSTTEHTFEGVADGTHTLTVIAHDGAGNSSMASVDVLVDTTYPSVTIVNPTNGTGFSHSDVSLAWLGKDKGDDIQYYEVWCNGEKIAETTSTMPSFNFNYLKDGYYTVVVKVVDQANSTATDSVTFHVDTIEPAVVSFAPQGDQAAYDTPITIYFSKEMDPAETTISVSGVTGTVVWNDLNATFTPSAHLANGTTYTVTVIGKDMVGNEINKTWTFTTADTEVRSSPSGFLGDMGWLVAVIAVVIVALLVYFNYRRKKEKGPPGRRSWKGMDDLQKRAGKGRKKHQDDDEEDLI